MQQAFNQQLHRSLQSLARTAQQVVSVGALAPFLFALQHGLKNMVRRARLAGDNIMRRVSLLLGLVAAVAMLGGCAAVPGSSASSMRTESAVQLPVKQGDEVIPANVAVKPITANLIIELDRAANPPPAEAARSQTITEPTRPDPTLQHLDYRLGPGDIINVIVWDHPELTIPAGEFRSAEASGTLVGEDGTIFFPYAGIIKVAGLSVREVRDILVQKLSPFIERVQLDVRVAAFRSQRVYVVGEVASPGLFEINDVPMDILLAVNRAGGFTTEADHSRVLLTRNGATYRVDLQALYEDAATAQNVRLQPGDIINVPDRQLNKIFVLGEVVRPGAQIMNKRRSTLAEALSEAGYVNQITSNPGWIFVMRGNAESSQLFHLNARSPDALLLADRFQLYPRDIVYVDVAEVARWNRVITNILPTANLLNTLSGTEYPLFGGRQ